jgi:hypothetical protein
MRSWEAARLGRAMRCGLLACAGLFTLVRPSPLTAADVEVVRLSIPDCGDTSGAEIAKLVGLELAPKLSVTIDESAPASMHARLRCAEQRATITVEDDARPTQLELSLSLADTRSEARARLLALAVAELIATSRLERGPPRPPPSAAGPEAPPQRAREVWLGAGVLHAFQPAIWLPAFAVGAADSFGHFAGAADAGFGWGQTSESAARIRVRLLALGLALGLHVEGERAAGTLGVGLRGGYAWLLATPRESGVSGRQLSGVFLAPIVQGAFELRLTEAWRARLGLELGYVVKPVRGLDADQTTLLALRGFLGSGLLALARHW